MQVNELIDALHKYPEKDVVIRLDNGLYCPITNINLEYGNIVIDSKSPITSAEISDFEPLNFNDSVEYILITEQKK